MNAQRQTNTFIKGMCKDLDYSTIASNQYLHADNIRVVTNESSSTAAIQSIEGLSQVLSSSTFGSEDIIHVNTVRDLAIVFTKSSDSKFSVYKLDFSNSDTNPTVTKLINQFNMSIGEMSRDLKINSVCRWEADDNVKIYWANGFSHIRMMNIMKPEDYDSIDDFETVPIGTLPPPLYNGLTGGSLKAGKYQFCYQLYNIRGTETSISAMSATIPVSKDEGTSDSSDIVGARLEENTGKGIRIVANVKNSSFNRARIYSIYYKNNADTPEINLVDDLEYNGESLVYNVTGNTSLNELTVDELNALITYVFVPKVLESKDNILFAANITEDTWDVPFEDFDARAYRFNPSGTTQLNSATGQNSIVVNYSSITTTDVPENHDCLNSYNQADGYRNNCYTQYDGQWIYGGKGKNIEFRLIQAALVEDDSPVTNNLPEENWTLNAEPMNYSNVSIDYVNSSGQKVSAGTMPLLDSNPKLLNYANPEIASKFVGYQRDETYRFGIVFYNEYAIPSPVHWICDIRMPKASDSGWEISGQSSTHSLMTYPIGVEFIVTGLPAYVWGYEIVRCERTIQDRRVIAQGIVTQVTEYGDENNSLYALPYMSYADVHGYAAIFPLTVGTRQYTFPMSNYSSGSYFTIASPDIAINRSNITEVLSGVTQIEGLYRLNSRVSPTVGSGSAYKPVCVNEKALNGDSESYVNTEDFTYAPGTGYVSSHTMFFGEDMFYNAILAKYYRKSSDNGSVGIADIDDIVLANETDVFDITNSQFMTKGTVVSNYTYYNWIWDNKDTDVDEDANNCRKAGPGGICAVFRSDDMLSENPLTNVNTDDQINEVLLANLIKGVTPYGGETYSLRQNNVYISTGVYKDTSESGNSVKVFGGDTYINVFDYAHCMFTFAIEDYQANNPNRLYSGAYFPVESTINLALRTDKIQISKTADKIVAGYANHFVQNNITQVGKYYSQGEPLYGYNDAYSAEGNARFYTASSIYDIDDLHTDVRIIASQPKTNNEVIDSWTQFKVANYLDVDTRYGSINALKTYHNILYYWQTDAFGQVSVNERSLIQDNNLGYLTLGTGGILTRYDYITTTNGLHADHTDAIDISDSTIYWWDYDRCELCAYARGINTLSKLKGMQSWLRNNKDSFTKDPHVNYDKKYNEVLFALDNTQLVFNEQIGAFTSFYTIDSSYWAKFSDKLYLFNQANLYKYNSGDTSNLIGSDKVSYIQFIVNENFIQTKTFDNVEYFGNFSNNTNFENIYFETNKQTSYVVDGIDYREDTYKFCIPRSNESSSDLNSNMTYSPRMKGHYLICNYTYDCNNGNTFKVPYISTAYRNSLI